jgi:hypothetical protein
MQIIFMVRQLLVGQDSLIVQATQSHSDAPYSVGIFWASDQPHAVTSAGQTTTLTRDRHHAPAGFGPAIPASERLQTYALDRAATGMGYIQITVVINW